METRALLAFVISLAILVGYNAFFVPAPVPVENVAESAGADTPRATGAGEAPAQAPAENLRRPPEIAEETISVDTPLYTAVFTSFGGRLKSFRLKEYPQTSEPQSPPLDMVESESLLPLGLYWSRADGTIADDRELVYRLAADGTVIDAGGEGTVELVATAPHGEQITKKLGLRGDSYVLRLTARVAGPDARAVGVGWARSIHPDAGRFAGVEGPTAFIGDELHAFSAVSLEEPELLEGAVSWAGYADHYFLAAYFPDEITDLRFSAAAGKGFGQVELWNDQADGSVSYALFIGPKSIHLLGDLGHQLDEAVALGWFSVVARPLLELLFFLHRFTGNYGWAILLLTVGIRIVFYPVNQKQTAAMKAMQRIQPEIKRIQEKFKDDRERLNKEMMEVYRRHKVNPLAGCLPMLIQIPVFIGLYNALMQAIELRHAPFIGWITDLSQPDRLGTWKLPFVSPAGIPVMTLLMGASMILQQRMQPATGDPVQQRMMMFMPVVFTLMFINFPAGLVLYWLANNVMMIGQQYLTNRSKT